MEPKLAVDLVLTGRNRIGFSWGDVCGDRTSVDSAVRVFDGTRNGTSVRKITVLDRNTIGKNRSKVIYNQVHHLETFSPPESQ